MSDAPLPAQGLTPARSLRAVGTIAAAAVLTLAGVVPAAASDPIDIPDDALRECIEEALDLDPGDDITESDAGALGTLSCQSEGIRNLTGMHHFTALTQLMLDTNEIADVGPLEGLTALTRLQLGGNQVADLGPLRTMTALEDLSFNGNQVADVGPLEGLTELEALEFMDNQVADVEPLSSLGNLNWVSFHRNSLTDISPLDGVDELRGVDQSIDLGELTAGEAQPNPVRDIDDNPVELDELYDSDANTFTPTLGGPESTSWSDENADFSGTLTFDTVVEPLVVTTTVEPSYYQRYDWDLAIEGEDVTVPTGQDIVEVDYEATVTPSGPEDMNFWVHGQVELSNPNAIEFEDVDVTVATDEPEVTCTVIFGDQVTVPAGVAGEGAGEHTAEYSCHLPDGSADDQVVVTAVATWDETDYPGSGGSADHAQTADFGPVEPEGQLNVESQLFDDNYHYPDGPVTFEAADGEQTLPYTLQWQAPEAGQCEQLTNTASLEPGDRELVYASDQATVEVCVEAPLEVSKNPDATFDRQYLWDIDKSVTTDGVVDDRNEAAFDYAVQVDQDGFVDSNWAMAGQIEVSNPNTFGEITFDLAEISDMDGAQCTTDGGTGVVLAGGEDVLLDYECTFADAPEYETTSTATVTWVDPAGELASASGSAEANFEPGAQIDAVVEVWDDHTDPDNPILLGEADQADEGTWTFDYTLILQGVVGQTVQFTNTAWIEVAGDNPLATTLVEIQIDEPSTDPAPEDDAEAEPEAEATSAMPATGAPIAGAAALALLLSLGGLGLMAHRRRSRSEA